MKYYQDPNGDYITVAEGSIKKTYAFFRIDKNKPQHRGSRVKTRPMLFFSTLEEGFLALADYAEIRQWKYIGKELPAIEVVEIPSQRSIKPPLFAWLDRQDRATEKPKTSDDEEYEIFKNEIVRQALLVAQNEMADWKNPDPLRAVQYAMTTLQQSQHWSSEKFTGLKRRILNDTGEKIGSKYQTRNMLGGVVQKVETKLTSVAHQISSQCPSNQ